ncbi:MAG: ferritin-like domain-containing protein [Halobacteriales archaeon]|nr:ferritin-like domain-containing protein [Halobacteriales archaeon]
MSVSERVASDHQLARLLQIGVVLEEVVEARAYHHYRALEEESGVEQDPEIAELLEHASEESAEHRERLEGLIDELDAESVPFDEVEALVREKYGQSRPEDFDGVLYDQLAGEETAYKFYDDLLGAIENSEGSFGVDRRRLLETLEAIRDEEAEGVEAVTDIMQRR